MNDIITRSEMLSEIKNYEPFWYTEPDIKRALELRFLEGFPYKEIPLTPIPEFDRLFRIECQRFMEQIEKIGWRFY